MDKIKREMFEDYVKSGINSFLLEDVNSSVFKNSAIIESNCDASSLNGHYENEDFVAPSWYLDLINNKKKILVIDNINDVSENEQGKFIEILRYRKVSTFDLPKSCIVVATCSNIKESPINEEVYSLMVHI